MHLSENVGRFLRPPGGQATTNFLQMVLPTLRMDLRAALLRMEEAHAPVEVFGVAVELEEGVSKLVDLRVVPASELAPGYVLVSFAARNPDTALAAVAASTPVDTEAVVRHLERELEAARARLRDTLERSHANDEEYKTRPAAGSAQARGGVPRTGSGRPADPAHPHAHRTRNGRTREPLAAGAAPVHRSLDDRIEGVALTLVDITARKRAEEIV